MSLPTDCAGQRSSGVPQHDCLPTTTSERGADVDEDAGITTVSGGSVFVLRREKH